MICRNCGLHDNFVPSLTDDRILCQCGAEKPIFENTKVQEGDVRIIKYPLKFGVMQVLRPGQIITIISVEGKYSTFKAKDNILVSASYKEIHKDLINDTVELDKVQRGGGLLTSIETKWFYENTEVVKDEI